jgi:methionine-rich copper-binding protein CopC
MGTSVREQQLSAVPLSRALIAAVLLVIAACAGNGEGLDANGQPLAPGSGAVPLSADFGSIQANIFTPICSVCHIGGGAPEGLRLDAANSYNLLVGVPSTEVPSLLRVKPGDPVNSYIIQKLQGHAAVGAQMPFGGPYLSADTIAFIQQWITNGALPAAAAAVASPLAVTSIVPASEETVSEPPPQIMIAFNNDLDVSQIDTRSVRIEKAPDGAQSAPEVIAARISVPDANQKALMVWPSRLLTAGHYRVVMDTASALTFMDILGHSIAVGARNDAGETVLTTFHVEAPP